MRIEICETNYSASPVGSNTWDILITTPGQTQIIPGQDTAADALNYLLSLYPNKELKMWIVPLQTEETKDASQISND
jgi:hypothetical protein